MKVFRTDEEVRAAVEEVRERLGLRTMIGRVVARARPYDEAAVFDPALTGKLRPSQLRFGHPDNELYLIEMRLREAEAALERPGGVDGIARARNAFEHALLLEEYMAGPLARAGRSRGGRAPKRSAAIYQAVLDYLRDRQHRQVGVREIWESFPQDKKANVYLSDGRKFLCTQGGDRIAFRSFLRYVTLARKGLELAR